MTGKDKVESGLAILVIGTYCYLTIIGKVDIAGLAALATYIVKKFLDGIDADKRRK